MRGGTTQLTRVLVVDDHEALRAALAEALSADGYEVRTAADAAAAWALLHPASEMPALIVLDVDLPDGSGLELLERIRALPQGHQARFVIMSAGRGHDLPLGVAYVQKPFILASFLGTVREELRRGTALAADALFQIEVGPFAARVLELGRREQRNEIENVLKSLARNPRPQEAVWDGPSQYRITAGSSWLRYRVEPAARRIVLLDLGSRLRG